MYGLPLSMMSVLHFTNRVTECMVSHSLLCLYCTLQTESQNVWSHTHYYVCTALYKLSHRMYGLPLSMMSVLHFTNRVTECMVSHSLECLYCTLQTESQNVWSPTLYDVCTALYKLSHRMYGLPLSMMSVLHFTN